MFDQTGTGGANNQWLTVSLYLYLTGWGEWNFGRAAAIAWLLFLIILIIGVLNLVATRTVVADAGTRDSLSRRQRRARAKAALAQVKDQKRREDEDRRHKPTGVTR